MGDGDDQSLGAATQRRQAEAAADVFLGDEAGRRAYDLEHDRDEVNNLAAAPEHAGTLERLRKANQEHLLKTRDIGLLTEAEMQARARNSTPYDVGHDDRQYPLGRVLAAAELASSRKPGVTKDLVQATQDPDSGVRNWE